MRGRTGSRKARHVGSDAGDERKANVRWGERATQGGRAGERRKGRPSFLSTSYFFIIF
jgi:hypothetical protein